MVNWPNIGVEMRGPGKLYLVEFSRQLDIIPILCLGFVQNSLAMLYLKAGIPEGYC